MAAGVERDPQAVLRGERDGRDDVVRGLWVDDRDRPLVDRQVPGLARGVPGLVARQDDVTVEAITEFVEVHLRPHPAGHGG